MNRSILLILGALLFLSISCASSQPEPAPRTAAATPDPAGASAGEPAQTAAVQGAADKSADNEQNEQPARDDGPIDLGMGNSVSDAPIVIKRPNTAADAAAMNVANETKKYDQKCETPADCEDLEALECAGEMQCVEKYCVYACAADDSDELGDADEADPSEESDEAGDDADENVADEDGVNETGEANQIDDEDSGEPAPLDVQK